MVWAEHDGGASSEQELVGHCDAAQRRWNCPASAMIEALTRKTKEQRRVQAVARPGVDDCRSQGKGAWVDAGCARLQGEQSVCPSCTRSNEPTIAQWCSGPKLHNVMQRDPRSLISFGARCGHTQRRDGWWRACPLQRRSWSAGQRSARPQQAEQDSMPAHSPSAWTRHLPRPHRGGAELARGRHRGERALAAGPDLDDQRTQGRAYQRRSRY